MAMTGLTYRYPATKTDINVYLGNDHFNLIVPGIQKKQKTSDSLYKKHLHYILHAPEQEKGSVFLLLNWGQATSSLCVTTRMYNGSSALIMSILLLWK